MGLTEERKKRKILSGFLYDEMEICDQKLKNAEDEKKELLEKLKTTEKLVESKAGIIYYIQCEVEDLEKELDATNMELKKMKHKIDMLELNNNSLKNELNESKRMRDNTKEGSEETKSGNSITVDSEVTMSPNILDENEHAQK